MPTYDGPDLRALVGGPLSRVQAIDAGLLVDATRAAAWVGFRVQAGMTVAAWEEVIGDLKTPTARERQAAGERLHGVWSAAAAAVAAYRQASKPQHVVRFTHPSASRPGTRVRLALYAGVEADAPFVTIALEAET